MSGSGSRKVLGATLIWLLAAGILAVGYKYYVATTDQEKDGLVSKPPDEDPHPIPKTGKPEDPHPIPKPVNPGQQLASINTGPIVRDFEKAWKVAVEDCGDSPKIDDYVAKVPQEAQASLREQLTAAAKRKKENTRAWRWRSIRFRVTVSCDPRSSRVKSLGKTFG